MAEHLDRDVLQHILCISDIQAHTHHKPFQPIELPQERL
jgi:hypothetical protein